MRFFGTLECSSVACVDALLFILDARQKKMWKKIDLLMLCHPFVAVCWQKKSLKPRFDCVLASVQLVLLATQSFWCQTPL